MSNYWRKRFELLEQKSNEYGLEAFRQIEPAFINAEKEIQKEIEAWYGRYAKNNNVSMLEARRQLSTKELKEFRWDVDEYIKYGRENAIDPKWMKELENASARVHINRLEALKIRTQQAAEAAFGNELDVIDEMARKVYTEDYYHSIFEMHKGFGIGWNVGQVDERKLGQLISKPWAADGKNFSQRIWNYRDQLVNELHTQMTQACVLGKHPKQLIDSISKKFKTTKGQAGRLVMTEQAFFHSAAQKDAFKELDVEEFEVVATLDSSTSDICQDMDGQHFKMSEYEPGVTAPPFHCWCRSVTAPYFEDNYGGERAARNADGETYYVPDDMKYKDWKEHFVDKTKDPADWLKRVDVSDVKKFDDSFVDTALEWYVSGQGQWVNQYLRNPEEWKADYGITDEELELIEAMKQGTNSEIVQESVLYRSVDASAVFGKMSQDEFESLRDFVVYNDKSKYALQAKAKFLDGIEGKEIVEKGFLSTTKEMDVALEWGDYTGSDKAITLELKVPKGIKGKDLKKFEIEDDEQFEVLLAPGQKYKIKEITTKEGQIYVKADLIADDIVDVKPKKVKFVAETIEDAEEYAKRFVMKQTWSGEGNVSYKGLTLEIANRMNEILTDLYDDFNIPLLRNLQPMNFKSNIFKGYKDKPVPFAYRNLSNGDLYFNPKIIKSKKTIDKFTTDAKDAFEFCKKNIDKFSPDKRKIIEVYLKAGRQIIADDCDDYLKTILEHEFGHHIDRRIFDYNKEFRNVTKKGKDTYALKISGYAEESIGEYVAESFAAFRNGHADLIDPELKKIFEGLSK